MMMAREKSDKNARWKANEGLNFLFTHLTVYKNFLHVWEKQLDSRNSPKAAKGK